MALSEITIEELSLQTLSPLTDLTLAFWPDCNYEEEFNNWKQLIGSLTNYCAIAKRDNQYIGFIHAGIRTDYVEGAGDGPTVYLEAIYTQPAFRRISLATLLLQHLENWSRSKGIYQIASDTAITNIVGQKFHKKIGFKEVGRVVCYVKELDKHVK